MVKMLSLDGNLLIVNFSNIIYRIIRYTLRFWNNIQHGTLNAKTLESQIILKSGSKLTYGPILESQDLLRLLMTDG
jgi:hypothetical protein